MKYFIRCFSILLVLIPATGADVEMVYGQLGGTVTLPMAAQVNIPKGYVYWTFDESNSRLLIRNNNFGGAWMPSNEDRWKGGKVSGSQTDFSLTIKDLKPEDFKTFTCEVRDSHHPIKTSKYQLLKMTVSPQNITVLAGESLSLNCEVDRPPSGIQLKTQPKIQWLSPQGQTKQQPNGRSAASQDHGDWTCEVSHNGITSGGIKSSVTVVDLSPGPSAPCYAPVSSPLNIPCSIPHHISWELLKTKGLKGGQWSFVPLSGVPLMLFSFSLEGESPPTWQVAPTNNMPLDRPDPDPQKRDLSLSRKKAMEADRGNYTCALEFKNGITLKRSVYVEVLKISSSPQQSLDTGLRVGQQVNLTCSLGHALASDLQVKWQPPHHEASVKTLPQPHTPIFTIAAVSEGDAGRWRCELVRNKTVVTSADITLKIARAPVDIWLYLTIGGVTAIIILTLILTVILMRRHRQRRRTPRHNRHRFCKCKNPKPKAFYKT